MAEGMVLLLCALSGFSGFCGGRCWQIQVHRRRMRPLLVRGDEAQERLRRLVLSPAEDAALRRAHLRSVEVIEVLAPVDTHPKGQDPAGGLGS